MSWKIKTRVSLRLLLLSMAVAGALLLVFRQSILNRVSGIRPPPLDSVPDFAVIAEEDLDYAQLMHNPRLEAVLELNPGQRLSVFCARHGDVSDYAHGRATVWLVLSASGVDNEPFGLQSFNDYGTRAGHCTPRDFHLCRRTQARVAVVFAKDQAVYFREFDLRSIPREAIVDRKNGSGKTVKWRVPVYEPFFVYEHLPEKTKIGEPKFDAVTVSSVEWSHGAYRIKVAAPQVELNLVRSAEGWTCEKVK